MTGVRGPICLIGCGKMGAALADGWLAAGLEPADLTIVEPNPPLRESWHARGTRTAASPQELDAATADATLVLAVKPQAMPEALAAVVAHPVAPAMVISVAAGVTIATLEAAFGVGTPIVRTMPNTPAAVGRGTTALVANAAASPASRERATALMGAVGTTVWLTRETDMHAVTALSGSGPAYVFRLVEALTEGGVSLGLERTVAEQLARATVSGAGALLEATDQPAATLRENVTSPGGTTAAALEHLMTEDALGRLIARAMVAAAEQSARLGGATLEPARPPAREHS